MAQNANTVLSLLKLRRNEMFLTFSRIAAVLLSERSNLDGSCSAIRWVGRSKIGEILGCGVLMIYRNWHLICCFGSRYLFFQSQTPPLWLIVKWLSIISQYRLLYTKIWHPSFMPAQVQLVLAKCVAFGRQVLETKEFFSNLYRGFNIHLSKCPELWEGEVFFLFLLIFSVLNSKKGTR